MERFIVLDTESTGFGEGHKVIEISAMEFDPVTGELRGPSFNTLLNPERDVDPAAFKVHGHSRESLQDEPVFADIAESFTSFVQGAYLVAHNAPFDDKMLSAELGFPLQSLDIKLVDTLQIATKCVFTGKHTLDDLCDFFQIDRTSRVVHGAKLDGELLAKIYPKLMARFAEVKAALKVLGGEGLAGDLEGKPFAETAKEYLTLSGIIGHFTDLKDQRSAALKAAYESGTSSAGGYSVSFSTSERTNWKAVQQKLLKGVDLSAYSTLVTRISVKMQSPGKAKSSKAAPAERQTETV